MTPELETALLRSASRHGVVRELCCPECRGVLGPRTQLIPLTCEHCGDTFQLRDTLTKEDGK